MGYGGLAGTYGINVIHDWGHGGRPWTRKTVALAGGGSGCPMTGLVLSPPASTSSRTAFRVGPSTCRTAMPHAYIGRHASGSFCAHSLRGDAAGRHLSRWSHPPTPTAARPAPHERISMVAHFLKENNPTAKILVADPKETFSKQGLFEDGLGTAFTPAWSRASVPISAVGNVSVDAEAMTISIGRRGRERGCLQRHSRSLHGLVARGTNRLCRGGGITDGNWGAGLGL